MPATTTKPYANRDPANLQDAAKCPVHQTRMTYKAATGSWACTEKKCAFEAHPHTRDITQLRTKKYTGNVKIYAAVTRTESGEEGTSIFMMLADWGVIIDVTRYIDLTVDEAIKVNDDQSAELCMVFPKIEFSDAVD